MSIPNIKTVRGSNHSLGVGDFTTIQAWEDWASSQSSAHQWAECYSHSDLGIFNISNWSATPTATSYPRVFASSGEAHGGVLDRGPIITAAGASVSGVLNIAVNYTQVEGLGSTRGFNIDLDLASNVTIENCWAKVDNGVGFRAKSKGSSTNSSNNVIKNCLALGGDMNDIGFEIGGEDMQGGTPEIACYHCTAYGHTNTGFKIFNTTLPGFNGGSTPSVQNCVSAAASGSDFSYILGGNGTNTFTNNASTDASAAASVNGYINQNQHFLFVKPTKILHIINASNAEIKFGGDFRPRPQSVLSDTGITLSSVNSDIRGVPRTIGEAPDIGAYETFSYYVNAAPLFITSQVPHNDSMPLVGYAEYKASGEAPLFSMGSLKFDSTSNTPIINGVLKPAIPPPTLYIGAPRPFSSGMSLYTISNYHTRISPLFVKSIPAQVKPKGISFTPGQTGVYGVAPLMISTRGDSSIFSRDRLPYATMPMHLEGLGRFPGGVPYNRTSKLFITSESNCFSDSPRYQFDNNANDSSSSALHFDVHSAIYTDGRASKYATEFNIFGGYYFKKNSHENFKVSSSRNKSVAVSFWIKKKQGITSEPSNSRPEGVITKLTINSPTDTSSAGEWGIFNFPSPTYSSNQTNPFMRSVNNNHKGLSFYAKTSDKTLPHTSMPLDVDRWYFIMYWIDLDDKVSYARAAAEPSALGTKDILPITRDIQSWEGEIAETSSDFYVGWNTSLGGNGKLASGGEGFVIEDVRISKRVCSKGAMENYFDTEYYSYISKYKSTNTSSLFVFGHPSMPTETRGAFRPFASPLDPVRPSGVDTTPLPRSSGFINGVYL